MKLRKHMISRVLPDSIAEELGLEPGDRLISVNGQPVEDVFDYRYLMNEELVVILVEKPDGEEWELEVEKVCSVLLIRCHRICVKRCILKMTIPGFLSCREIM